MYVTVEGSGLIWSKLMGLYVFKRLFMLELTESNYQNETSTGVVVVDFWAEWCNPCKMLMPVLEKLALKYETQVKFCKVDTSDSTKLAALNNISALPTLLIFKDGQIETKLVGLQPEKKILDILDKLI